MKKQIVHIVLISMVYLLACTSKNNKNDFVKNTDSIPNSADSNQNNPSIIAGKILNLEVYPHIREVKLTIPGFEGDEMVYTTEIKENGQFTLEFYPKTKREVNLYPIRNN